MADDEDFYEPDDEVDKALRDHHRTIDRLARASGVKAPRYGPPHQRAGAVERQIERKREARVLTYAAAGVAAVGAALWKLAKRRP